MERTDATADTSYQAEIARYRQSRLARLTAEDGWLALVDRAVLEPGTTELPIGALTVDGAQVTFRPAAAALTVDGAPARGELPLGPVEGGPPIVIQQGAVRHELVRRAGVFIVRVRDPRSPARVRFPGIETYPVDPAWRLPARFVPHDTRDGRPKMTTIAYEIGVAQAESPGTLIFDLPGGGQGRLDALFDEDGGRRRLYILFADATNRDETYGGGRFFYAPLPHGGVVPLDFNKALNPPCVFTPYATCPLPPPENRLAFRVTAGEKRFAHDED